MLNEFLTSGGVWGCALTIAAYGLGWMLNKKTGKAWCNPLLLAVLAVIAFLAAADIPYENYKASAAPISYLLMPATVCHRPGRRTGRTFIHFLTRPAVFHHNQLTNQYVQTSQTSECTQHNQRISLHTSAYCPLVTRRRSSGRHSICDPIRPPLTKIFGRSFAVLWKVVTYAFFMPTGEHPPRT